jgi:polyhydroxyalkanoate synthesis regulator phasin
MSHPRRRLLRSSRSLADDGLRQTQLVTRRSRLEAEQQALSRWMSRLKRAFHAVEKQQQKVTRLEREISRLQQG